MTLNEKDQIRLNGYASASRSEQQFTDEQLIQALKDAANGDKPLSRQSYQTHYEQTKDSPHPYTIIRRFDRWNAALEAAGLPFRKRAPYQSRVDQNDCVGALLEAREQLGHLPSIGEYQSLRDKDDATFRPSASTIRLKFGKWRDACAEAAKRIA